MSSHSILIDEKNVLLLYKDYAIPFGKSISFLIQAILDNPEIKVHLTIKVKREYIPRTYINNPALYARQLKSEWIISCYKTDFNVVVHRGQEKISNCFFGKAIRSIRELGTFHALKGSIPISYLTRPRQFAKLLEHHFGFPFAIVAKRRSIRWSKIKLTFPRG